MSDHRRPDKNASAAARLRHAIDSGNTGDKVNYPDPAAAPLGTDDEAAGTRPVISEADIQAETTRPPERQRRWIPFSLGERSVLLVLAVFLFTLAIVIGWYLSAARGG